MDANKLLGMVRDPFAHLKDAGTRREEAVADRLKDFEARIALHILRAIGLRERDAYRYRSLFYDQAALSWLTEYGFPYIVSPHYPKRLPTTKDVMSLLVGSPRVAAKLPMVRALEEVKDNEEFQVYVVTHLTDCNADVVLSCVPGDLVSAAGGRMFRRLTDEFVVVVDSLSLWLSRINPENFEDFARASGIYVVPE